MSCFWITACESKNSWSGGSLSASGFSTVKANSNFSTDKKNSGRTEMLYRGRNHCCFNVGIARLQPLPDLDNLSKCHLQICKMTCERRMSHHQLHVGGCFQTGESDRPKVRGSECAANQGKLSGSLPHSPVAEEKRSMITCTKKE